MDLCSKGWQALPLKRKAKLSSNCAVFLQSPARLTLMLIMLGGALLAVREGVNFLAFLETICSRSTPLSRLFLVKLDSGS